MYETGPSGVCCHDAFLHQSRHRDITMQVNRRISIHVGGLTETSTKNIKGDLRVSVCSLHTNRSCHPTTSAHPVSVLIFPPREIEVHIYVGTDCETDKTKVSAYASRQAKRMRSQRTGYDNTTINHTNGGTAVEWRVTFLPEHDAPPRRLDLSFHREWKSSPGRPLFVDLYLPIVSGLCALCWRENTTPGVSFASSAKENCLTS